MKTLKRLLYSFMILFLLVGICTFYGCENKVGEFLRLNEAYESGYLTNEDLIIIAYDYNHGRNGNKEIISEDYTPKPKDPKELSNKIQKKIKQAYLSNIIKDNTLSDKYINIYAYYGTYNGAIAIGITDNYNVYDKIIIKEYKVGEVIFYNYSESDIRIWVE